MTNYLDVLIELKTELFGSPSIKFEFSNDCYNNFQTKPGVYAIYDENTIIYAGESGNLRQRMKDIRNTQNHNIRRLLGEHHFSNHKHYWKASSTKKFHPEVEALVISYIESNIYVRSIATVIGRKELEELITSENKQLLNKRKKRI
jgi:hypothetical protein